MIRLEFQALDSPDWVTLPTLLGHTMEPEPFDSRYEAIEAAIAIRQVWPDVPVRLVMFCGDVEGDTGWVLQTYS